MLDLEATPLQFLKDLYPEAALWAPVRVVGLPSIDGRGISSTFFLQIPCGIYSTLYESAGPLRRASKLSVSNFYGISHGFEQLCTRGAMISRGC